ELRTDFRAPLPRRAEQAVELVAFQDVFALHVAVGEGLFERAGARRGDLSGRLLDVLLDRLHVGLEFLPPVQRGLRVGDLPRIDLLVVLAQDRLWDDGRRRFGLLLRGLEVLAQILGRLIDVVHALLFYRLYMRLEFGVRIFRLV